MTSETIFIIIVIEVILLGVCLSIGHLRSALEKHIEMHDSNVKDE